MYQSSAVTGKKARACREPLRGPGKHCRGAPNIFAGSSEETIFDIFSKWCILVYYISEQRRGPG